MADLTILHVAIKDVEPNKWNPNRQNSRQYEAEIESICQHGFITPILVRKAGKKFEIVDGEHRWRALNEIFEKKIDAGGNVPSLMASQTIPVIVLDVSDAQAKKLTVIMNETRGRPNIAELGQLLHDLQDELGDDLITGLPYLPQQLDNLIGIGHFDWDSVDSLADLSAFDGEDESDEKTYALAATLDEDTNGRWKKYLTDRKDELPKDPKLAAGALITHLLNQVQA